MSAVSYSCLFPIAAASSAELPVPKIDGACDHLINAQIPPISLAPTSDPGNPIDLSALTGVTVIYCYPRTGGPKEAIPADWHALPGARGCTPQSCSFRDSYQALLDAGADRVFGLSTQSSWYHQEVKQRLGLPFELLSDPRLHLVLAMQLPRFTWEERVLIKRCVFVIVDNVIRKVFYPVFPPENSAQEVLSWMKTEEGKAVIASTTS